MSRLAGYTVGGTIHIIINNQVGFTTDPKDARSVLYSSDVAKSIKAPVLLVNGDDVEACVRAMDMAVRFRQQFGEDIVIDQICYRRYGHNEGDEPAFTQPVMYEHIKKHPTLLNIYAQKLEQDNVLGKAGSRNVYQRETRQFAENSRSDAQDAAGIQTKCFLKEWKGLRRGKL